MRGVLSPVEGSWRKSFDLRLSGVVFTLGEAARIGELDRLPIIRGGGFETGVPSCLSGALSGDCCLARGRLSGELRVGKILVGELLNGELCNGELDASLDRPPATAELAGGKLWRRLLF